jgi:PAS domain S-box-containing protein
MAKSEDNSELAETKRELALLSWIQQSAPYGVFTLDASLQVKSWNRWMETHSGLAGAEVLGRGILELYPELTERKLTGPFQRALAGESSVLSTALHQYLLPFKSPLSSAAKDRMRQTARVTPLLFAGDICGLIVVIEDVTQREAQAETVIGQHRRDEILAWALVYLLRSDEPRKTVRQLFFKIAEYLDLDTFLLYLRDEESGAVKLYTAGGIADNLQTHFLDCKLLTRVADASEPVIYNAVQDRPEPEFALLKAAKISAAIVLPLHSNNKSLGSLGFASWSRDHIAPTESDLLTTIAQYLATAVDKENTNRELRRSEAANQWMGAMVESSEDAIISKDLEGIIKSCNLGAAELFGYEIHELIGQPMQMLIPAGQQHEETEILVRLRNGLRVERFETVRRRKDGSLIEVSLTTSPVVDATGKVLGASQIARDITDRRRAEQKLAESYQREKLAREKAELANSAKDDFLASLSHELRTPLNPILLIASDAAENPDFSPEVKAQFETIRKNIELEARLIDDLLDVTRIANGKLSLHLRPVDLQAILEETIRNVQADLNEKRIALTFDFQASSRRVYGDDVRLQQVFWNVLKNAIKFTPVHGRITVSLQAAESHLRVAITDTGIGMAPNELKQIFEAFSQGDRAKNVGRRFGGLGLGLAIARRLVEMHDGTITAASEGAERGSTFTIQLPAFEAETAQLLLSAPARESEVQETTEPARRILLVEDHEPTRNVLAHMLQRRGYKVVVAGSAQAARKASALEKFDLVISDIGLPDSTGNELMKYLSVEFGLKGIALTGYGMEEDVEKCLASGFVTHLIKPVNVNALESAMASILDAAK